MGANEKLGISIEINEVTVAGDLASKISTKVQDLGKDVKPVKVGVEAGDMAAVVASLKGIAEQLKNLSGVAEKTASGFKATKKEVQNFAEAFTGGDLKKAKEKMEELYDTKKMKQWSKEYQSELATIMKQQEAGHAASKRGIEANAQAAKAALNTQINSGTANLSIYKNSGLQPVNGGYVNASVNTKQGLDEAHAAALKLNAALGVTKTIDPFKDIFKGLPVATTTLTELHSKLTAVYGDLTKLDGKSLGNVTSQLSKYNAELKNGTVQAKQTAGAFDFLGASLGKMATRLAEFYSIRTVLFAVGSAFRDATKSALDMNQAVHDILAISGESKDQFSAISESIYAIAKSSRYTANEVAASMQVLAQAGVAAKDLSHVAKQTDWFASAVGADPKIAADLVTTSMNVFEIGANKITRITNAMTAALNLSKLEASGLSTAFAYLAPQASQLGMSMEQTLGIIANMSQSGIKPSTIGTGVSQMLKEFSAPKPRLRKMLEAYGIDESSINPMKHDFADIVQTLQNAKVSVADLFAAMETRVGRSAVTAINLSANSFREMTTNITGTSAALIAYDKSMEGARARLNVIKQTFAELATTVGSSLAPALIIVTEVLKGTLIVLGGMDGIVSKLVVGLVTLAAAVYPVIAAARALTAAGALGGLLVGFSTGGVALAIGAIVTAIGGLMYALNSSNRAKEEARKLELEQIDRGERIDRTLTAIVNGTDKSSAAYRKYQQALSEGKSVAEAIALVDSNSITIKDEQRAALQKFIADGGPHSKYLEKLLEEKDLLTAIATLQNIRTLDKNVTVSSNVQEYNKEQARLEGSQKVRAQDLAGRFLDGTPKNQLDLPKFLEEIKRRDAVTLAKLADEMSLYGAVLGNENGPTHEVNFKNGRAVIDEKTSPKAVNAERKTGGDTKAATAARVAAEKQAKNDESFSYWVQQQKDKANIENIRRDKADLERDITNKEKTEEERRKALIAVEAQNLTLFMEERAKKVEELNKKFADTNGMLWDSENGVFRDPKNLQEDGRGKVIKTDNPLWKKAVGSGNVGTRDAYASYLTTDMKGRTKDANDKNLDAFNKANTVKEAPPSTARLAKEADFALRVTLQRLALEKEGVWTAQEREQIEVQMADATLDNSKKKAVIYQAEIDHWNKQKVLSTDEKAKLESAVDLHAETLELIKQQAAEVQKIQNMNPWSSFTDGARGAWSQQTDINAQSKQLGGNLVNTGVNGVTDSIVGATNAMFNPDKEKVNSIKAQIAQLNVDKAQLTTDIAIIESNTSKTPAEVQALNDKKVALNGINESLKTQQDSLKKQTNAWASFAEGLKKTMVIILEELQRYIVQLFVVAAAKKMIWLAVSAFAPTTTSPDSLGSSGTSGQLAGSEYSGATGGLFSRSGFSRYAEGGLTNATAGGFVPKLPGTQWGVDGVHALIAPGEVVIKRSSVQAIGAEKLLYANDHGRLPSFASGGLVGGKPAQPSDTKQNFTLQIVNIAQGDQVPNPGENTQQILNVINNDIARRGPTYKTIKAAVAG